MMSTEKGEYPSSARSTKASSRELPPPPYGSHDTAHIVESKVLRRTFSPSPPSAIDLYLPKGSTLDAAETTNTVTLPAELHHDTGLLFTLLMQQSILLPKPVVRIKGWSYDYNIVGGPVTDFELLFNMTDHLEGQQWHYMLIPLAEDKLTSSTGPELEEMSIEQALLQQVEHFEEAEATDKRLVFERKVTGWNTELLRDRLHALVVSTKYQGRIEITFPTKYSKVIFQYDCPTVQATQPTSYSASFLRTSLAKLSGKPRPNEDARDGGTGILALSTFWPHSIDSVGQLERTYALKSEEAWFEQWKDAIRNAVLSKKQCWMTLDDLMTFKAGVNISKERKRAWGYDA